MSIRPRHWETEITRLGTRFYVSARLTNAGWSKDGSPWLRSTRSPSRLVRLVRACDNYCDRRNIEEATSQRKFESVLEKLRAPQPGTSVNDIAKPL